jgi:pimeloyl-ACP methyl ester carboxylesterase
VPILILPYSQRSKEVMKPFLAELEKTNKLFYIQLPPISSFKNIPTVSDKKIPYYPIDNLVKAFEDLRKGTGQERFALMACGLNSWIAMRYASLYPKSVSHLVFINPISSQKAFGDGYDRAEKVGKSKNDVELWHYALAHSFNSQTGESVHDIYHKDKKIPVPDGEGASLSRRGWSLFFKDERDSLATILYGVQQDEHAGGAAIPEFKCFSEPKRNIPTIVIYGAANLLASQQDCEAIAKHYGGRCYVYPGSSGLPFAEESATFNKHMAALLRENVKSLKKKEKEKKTPEGASEKGAADGEGGSAAAAEPKAKVKEKPKGGQ